MNVFTYISFFERIKTQQLVSFTFVTKMNISRIATTFTKYLKTVNVQAVICGYIELNGNELQKIVANFNKNLP